MGRACNTQIIYEKFVQRKDLKRRDHVRALDVNERLVLKWIDLAEDTVHDGLFCTRL
jgi:hypothetical protein